MRAITLAHRAGAPRPARGVNPDRTQNMEAALKLSRRALVAVGILAGLCATHAFAQTDYPIKSIRLVVGFTAGGISDVLARALGARLSTQLGQQVVVDNRPGAGTTIASEIVAKSPPDGYTLFLQDMTTQAINASLYKKLPYDTVKDFTPITLIASSPLMLVVHPSLPVKSINELIALGKSKPGQIAFASSGNGTILHLAAETFKTMAGIPRAPSWRMTTPSSCCHATLRNPTKR